jgi:hypothetical protein
MQYILLIITLAAALIGILGPTHREGKEPIVARITALGWGAMLFAVLGFFVSVWTIHQQARGDATLRHTAAAEIRRGLDDILDTLYLAAFVVFEERRKALPFRGSPSIEDLLAEPMVRQFEKTSLSPRRRLRRLYLGIPDGTTPRDVDFIISSRARDARGRLQSMIQFHDVLGPDFVASVTELSRDKFLEYLCLLPEHIDDMNEREDSSSYPFPLINAYGDGGSEEQYRQMLRKLKNLNDKLLMTDAASH